MTNEQQWALWEAINRYASACGGSPAKNVYGNTRRQKAVADVERIVRDIAAPLAPPPAPTGEAAKCADCGDEGFRWDGVLYARCPKCCTGRAPGDATKGEGR